MGPRNVRRGHLKVDLARIGPSNEEKGDGERMVVLHGKIERCLALCIRQQHIFACGHEP